MKLLRQKHFKMQQRLFLDYVLIALIILISFALFFYRYVSPILINNEMESLSAQNKSFSNQVDDVLYDLDITSANINYSNLMKDKLDSSFNLDINESNLPGLVDLFVTINGTDVKADQINLYDFSGNEIRVGITSGTSIVDVNSLPWFSKVKSLGGIKLISTPYYSDAYSKTIHSPDWFISIYRTYSNQYGKKIGAIETVKRCKTVFKSIISYNKKNGSETSVYVFDSDGNLVYPYSISDDEKDQTGFYYAALNSDNEISHLTNPYTLEDENITYTTSAYSGWTYISVLPTSTVLTPATHLLLILSLAVFLLLLLSLLPSYYLAQNMVKPIKHLKHRIQRLAIENLGEQKEASYIPNYDELAELYSAFETMSHKLNISMNELIESRQQEIKSRTLALQAQTNPHFYYNTLSSIIVLSENKQTEEVITLCRNLSLIMRYITDSSSSTVSLADEIDYVKKYFYCMKVRYLDSLQYIIDIDSELLSLKVPKLIIQPLVENAIKYGTDCIPPWTIKIVGRSYEDHWQIDVIDSGNGFSKEAIDRINFRIKVSDIKSGVPELKINGLGLVNVYIRWKLYCHDNYIFYFGNTEDGHGIISIGANKNITEWRDKI